MKSKCEQMEGKNLLIMSSQCHMQVQTLSKEMLFLQNCRMASVVGMGRAHLFVIEC